MCLLKKDFLFIQDYSHAGSLLFDVVCNQMVTVIVIIIFIFYW